MAELADALDSGSSGGNFVEVQVLLPAPKRKSRISGFFFLYFYLSSLLSNLRFQIKDKKEKRKGHFALRKVLFLM